MGIAAWPGYPPSPSDLWNQSFREKSKSNLLLSISYGQNLEPSRVRSFASLRISAVGSNARQTPQLRGKILSHQELDPSLRSGFRRSAQTPAKRLNLGAKSCFQRT